MGADLPGLGKDAHMYEFKDASRMSFSRITGGQDPPALTPTLQQVLVYNRPAHCGVHYRHGF